MRIICDGVTLGEAVTKVSKACAMRTTAPILECIKIEAQNDEVVFLASDGEISIRKTIKAEVMEEGEACVPAASEFPKINFEIGENSFVMKQGDLKKIIAETTFCCAADDSRPVLKGCLLEFKDKLEITALDGYRLALSTAAIAAKTGELSIICPARTLQEISRMLSSDEEEITLYTQGGMLMVKFDTLVIVSRLYQGEFIRKESVLPAEFLTTVTLSREELILSAERAAILIRGDKNNLVTLDIRSGAVNISSASEYGNVSESVSAEIEGKELVVSMNAKYLLDALRALHEETVVMSFNGAYSPFILQDGQEKDSLYLILPVRNAA